MLNLKKVLLLIFFSIPFLVIAQPTINNCENFSYGTTLRFIGCNPTNIFAGAGGSGRTWNFSGLSSLGDTLTEWMVSPSSTSHGSQFPLSNLVEKYSDGTMVYVIESPGKSEITGYLDTSNNFTIHYQNPNTFAVRPITYGNAFADTFSMVLTSPSYSIHGVGIDSIIADGYGTLILPNGTFNNVLRVKIKQIQNDTMTPPGTVYTSTTISYTWFDSFHTSALMKIDSTHSPGYTNKSVEYLLDETSEIEVNRSFQEFRIFPDPANEELNIIGNGKGYFSIYDPFGRILKKFKTDENLTRINTANLPSGLYFISCISGVYQKKSKFIIVH